MTIFRSRSRSRSRSKIFRVLPGAGVLLPAALVALAALVWPAAARAQIPQRPLEEMITLNVWTVEDAIIHSRETTPEERLLREAQYTLSGMIYGWDFTYTPGDPRRRIPEVFVVTPVSTVPWGSAGLRLRDLRAVENTLWAQIDYTLSEMERAHRSRWISATLPRSGGVGHGELLAGWRGKESALEDALRMAVREHLRSRHPNRPLDARGSVVLVNPPRVRTTAGRYEARLTVAVDVQEVRDFLVY